MQRDMIDNDMDYCDLDPAKKCDNCCRCIDTGRDYEDFEIALTHSIQDIADILCQEDMTLDFFDENDEYSGEVGQSVDVSPIEVDPALVAEWEKKLRDI